MRHQSKPLQRPATNQASGSPLHHQLSESIDRRCQIQSKAAQFPGWIGTISFVPAPPFIRHLQTNPPQFGDPKFLAEPQTPT